MIVLHALLVWLICGWVVAGILRELLLDNDPFWPVVLYWWPVVIVGLAVLAVFTLGLAVKEVVCNSVRMR